VGPVEVATYGETVSAANLVERLDYYTHELPPAPGTDRKEFVAALAEAIMPKVFDVPAEQWEPLAKVIGEALGAREAMAWSTDSEVARVLGERGWDGAVPEASGDFVLPAEFEYANKNGRDLVRTYDHHVAIRADGSARVTTKVTIANVRPVASGNFVEGLTYITMYGPAGAMIDTASDPLGVPELPVAGHPATGWFRPLTPLTQATLTAVWNAPNLVVPRPEGGWDYSLLWMRHPDHTGDTLNLSFELPPGWRWADAPPPAQSSLDADIKGRWALASG